PSVTAPPKRGGNYLVSQIIEIVKTEKISGIIVGLPLYSDGTDSGTTRAVRAFAAQLAAATDAPIAFVEEALTSAEAEEIVGTNTHPAARSGGTPPRRGIDAHAAAVILENATAMIKRETAKLKEMLEFYRVRTVAHINSVNYFGKIFGLSFARHDADKLSEPIMTPYAFKVWQNYHPDFKISGYAEDNLSAAHAAHHLAADHHVEFYKDISQMPDDKVIEMIGDWYTANLENRYINRLRDREETFDSVTDFYLSVKDKWKFTEHQNKLISSAIRKIESEMKMDEFLAMWRDLEAME
ncbi:MAG: Holliday junction resolvase RuvX, partial [Proteobacteria bacterium]|nr:Holliday junction resolvase RuvX [Pseudomonadota bacterium]